MTQPASKRLVTEARFTDISNAATAAAQSKIDASAAAASSSATAAQNSANLVGAPAGSAIDTYVGSGASVAVRKSDLPINARDYGVKADGNTDDRAAWQTLVNNSAPGTVITWAGKSMLNGAIIWKSGVSLVGQGRGNSILAPRDLTGSVYFSAIQRTASDGASTTSELRDCTFRNFEVDGSSLTGTQHNVGAKALFIQFARRCQFLNLYLHDTVGTALGCDFLPQCLIDGVVVERGGRNWDGVDGGHAGIGIGTGAYPVEDVLITNCSVNTCGQWGIFTEWQANQPYHSKGPQITNNVAMNCQGSGIGDIGNVGVYIAGNYCSGNGTRGVTDRRDGITIYGKAEAVIVVNNTCEANAGEGISVNAFAYDNHTVRGNTCRGNTRNGIFIDSPTTTARTGMQVVDNRCHANQLNGIKIASGSTAIIKNTRIDRNHCYNNGQALTSGWRRGIDIFGGMADSTVNGNRCYDDQATPTQDNGIVVASGTWTNTLMEGNNFVGQASAGSFSGTLTGLTRRNNLGYVTEARGTATVAAGQATFTVLHGLSTTPTIALVTPRTNENMWVTTIGASGFIVNRAVTTAALDFTWSASV